MSDSIPQNSNGNTSGLTLPIHFHNFEFNGDFYSLEIDSLRIFKTSLLGSKIFQLAGNHSLLDILKILGSDFSQERVKAFYLKVLTLYNDDFFKKPNTDTNKYLDINKLVIIVTEVCNLNCTYCFEEFDIPKLKSLTIQKSKELIDWYINIFNCKNHSIEFYGGEALLNWKTFNYILNYLQQKESEHGIKFTKYLITNGTLINEKIAQILKQHDVSVQVSIDGDKENHDKYRKLKNGDGSYDLIRENINILELYNVNYNIRAVLTKKNQDPNSVIESFNSFKTKQLSFEIVTSADNGIRLSKEDWADYHQNYKNYLYQSLLRRDGIPIEMQKIIDALKKRQYIIFGCSAGKQEITVKPNGDIHFCQRIFDPPFSNIALISNKKDLDNDFISPVYDKNGCANCWAKYLCGGGCKHQSIVEMGQDKAFEEFCIDKKNLVEASIIRYFSEKKKENALSKIE